jgi:hypothetical protein
MTKTGINWGPIKNRVVKWQAQSQLPRKRPYTLPSGIIFCGSMESDGAHQLVWVMIIFDPIFSLTTDFMATHLAVQWYMQNN